VFPGDRSCANDADSQCLLQWLKRKYISRMMVS
jgi:hypothetical protein